MSAHEDYSATIHTLCEMVVQMRGKEDCGERQRLAREGYQLAGALEAAIKAFHTDTPERVERAGELIQIKLDFLEFL